MDTGHQAPHTEVDELIPNTLVDESEGAVLGADLLTLNTHNSPKYAGAKGRVSSPASSRVSFDVQVMAVAPHQPDGGHQPGLPARQLMIGFCTPGASYELGTHLKKDGPASSWAIFDGKAITEKKTVAYGEVFGVGDVVTATLVDGTIRYAINDRDLGQAFKLDGRDLRAIVHPVIVCKDTAVRVRLDPAPLWPDVAIQFAMTRNDASLAASALASDDILGNPEDQVKRIDSLVADVVLAMPQFTFHKEFVLNAAELLRRYARFSTQHQTELVDLGAVAHLAQAMQEHRTDPDALAVLISTCWNIAVNNTHGQVALSDSGVPHLIKTAMYRHSGSMALQKAATSGILPWVLRHVPAAASPIKSPVRSPGHPGLDETEHGGTAAEYRQP